VAASSSASAASSIRNVPVASCIDTGDIPAAPGNSADSGGWPQAAIAVVAAAAHSCVNMPMPLGIEWFDIRRQLEKEAQNDAFFILAQSLSVTCTEDTFENAVC
jgi:hypothetical protein